MPSPPKKGDFILMYEHNKSNPLTHTEKILFQVTDRYPDRRSTRKLAAYLKTKGLKMSTLVHTRNTKSILITSDNPNHETNVVKGYAIQHFFQCLCRDHIGDFICF